MSAASSAVDGPQNVTSIPNQTLINSELDGTRLRIGRQAMQDQSKPKARHAEPLVLGALSDTRVVALVGPRQSGKTTLVRKIADDREMSFITLDDEHFCQFVNDDPSRFIRGLDHAVRSHPGA